MLQRNLQLRPITKKALSTLRLQRLFNGSLLVKGRRFAHREKTWAIQGSHPRKRGLPNHGIQEKVYMG